MPAVLFATLLATRATLADGPETAPTITGPVVAFDKPRVWPDSLSETWTLVDGEGRVICELPCSSPVPSASGYVLEGVAIFATGSGTPAKGEPGTRVEGPLRLPLPRSIDVGAATYARLAREVDPGAHVLARVHPGKGSPNGAIAVGIVSGVVLVFGAAIVGASALSSCSGGGCPGNAFYLIPGLGLGGIGLVGGIAALAWGASSARPGIDIFSDRPATHASNSTPIRVTLSPFGLAGTF